jgi:hypothetical protein
MEVPREDDAAGKIKTGGVKERLNAPLHGGRHGAKSASGEIFETPIKRALIELA